MNEEQEKLTRAKIADLTGGLTNLPKVPEEKTPFVPTLKALLEHLAEEIEGWADSLGTEYSYSDPFNEDWGFNDWADQLQRVTDKIFRKAGTLLAAKERTKLAGDLRQRVETLFSTATGYEQRLEALEDHRRDHVLRIIARYKTAFGEEDPEALQLGQLCQGFQRTWALKCEEQEMEPQTPDDFAEAIDKAYFHEEGAKRRAQAEVRRQAKELIEHLRLLSSLEAPQSPKSAKKKVSKKRPKKGAKKCKLTDKQSQAINLFCANGLNYSKGAREMGVSPKTFRQHVEAAREKMPNILEELDRAKKFARPEFQNLPHDKRGQVMLGEKDEGLGYLLDSE